MVATIVSLLAVAISLVALSLQFVRTFWERPYVFVGGLAGSHRDSQMTESHWEYRIDVTNVGERAVTLIEVGLLSERRPDGYMTHGLSAQELEDFPLRLEPHDSRSWTIPGGPTRSGSREAEPWVKIVRRPSWIERRRRTLPERTIVGRLFGSMGPELNGTPVGRPSKRQIRATAKRRQEARAARRDEPLL